jgi:hypothetical protein
MFAVVSCSDGSFLIAPPVDFGRLLSCTPKLASRKRGDPLDASDRSTVRVTEQ